MEPKYPNIQVNLTGLKGNILLILSRTNKGFIEAGVPQEEHQRFLKEFNSACFHGDELEVLRKWVSVDLSELTQPGYKPE